MNGEPRLSKVGSGCSIKGVKYKWRLDNYKVCNFRLKSMCKGKYLEQGYRSVYFQSKADAMLFYVGSY